MLRNKISTESLHFLDSSQIAQKIKDLTSDPYGELPDVPEKELDPKNADAVRKKIHKKGEAFRNFKNE